MGQTCEQLLMLHTFAFSYGQPFVGWYSPPSCNFNRVVLNFTVSSAGRQFDRLGYMFLNDTEVFRTSTAEPTASGIVWSYSKDVSGYLCLFRQRQKIIFDLGNLINDKYTASFDATLTAAFFSDDGSFSPADVILPVSSRRSGLNQSSVFSVPDDQATSTLTLPRNAKRAVFSISACGQSWMEEFWWSNVPSSRVKTFPPLDDLAGRSPFREIQLFIDGALAGVAWPFPIVFTGGVVPGFWRPIVGIDAFDLREDEIDISPFLPLLSDGGEHSFEIRVVGIRESGDGGGQLAGAVNGYWVVTGKIFLWLDRPGWITTGARLDSMAPSPSVALSSRVGEAADGSNATLDYTVDVGRHLAFTSTVHTSDGVRLAFWQQALSYSSTNRITYENFVQLTAQRTRGHDVSSHGCSKTYDYPLRVNSSQIVDVESGNYTIQGAMDRGKAVRTFGSGAFPPAFASLGGGAGSGASSNGFAGTSLTTRQNGTAVYSSGSSSSAAFSYGSTEQDLVFAGIDAGAWLRYSAPPPPAAAPPAELYRRHVLAVNGSVVRDEEWQAGKAWRHARFAPTGASLDFAPVDRTQIRSRGLSAVGAAPRD